MHLTDIVSECVVTRGGNEDAVAVQCHAYAKKILVGDSGIVERPAQSERLGEGSRRADDEHAGEDGCESMLGHRAELPSAYHHQSAEA